MTVSTGSFVKKKTKHVRNTIKEKHPIFFSFLFYFLQFMSTLATKDHLVPRYPTAVNKTSPEYKNNEKEWKELIEQLNERLQEATGEGKPKSIALHRKRGQLTGTCKKVAK